MMTNIVHPKTITGAPIDWIIGGNPLLGASVFREWMVCFKTSYDFFMIALDGTGRCSADGGGLRGCFPARGVEIERRVSRKARQGRKVSY